MVHQNARNGSEKETVLRFLAVFSVAALCVPKPGVAEEVLGVEWWPAEVQEDPTAPDGTAREEDGDVAVWGRGGTQPRGGGYALDLHPSADASYSTIGEHPSAWSASGSGGWDSGGGGAAEDHGGWHHKHKVLSVSAVFQISLTALAFLAFAGFLLHLVVLASRGHKDSGAVTTTMAPTAEALVLVPLKRPKAVGGRADELEELTRRVARATEGPDAPLPL